MTLTRRALLVALLGVRSVPAEAAGVHLTGALTATEQESQEGYFAMGRELMIVARPKSPVHRELQGMVGREVQLSVFTTSEQG